MSTGNTRKTKQKKRTRPSTMMKKPYEQMTTEELRDATKEFDREFASDTFGQPTRKAKAQLERARKRGRPKVGEGAEKILLTLERGFVRSFEELRKELQIDNRSEFVAQALQLLMRMPHAPGGWIVEQAVKMKNADVVLRNPKTGELMTVELKRYQQRDQKTARFG